MALRAYSLPTPCPLRNAHSALRFSLPTLYVRIIMYVFVWSTCAALLQM